MAMGFGANFAIVIDNEKLEEMNLGSYTNLLQALKERNVSMDSFASSIYHDDMFYDEDGEEVKDQDFLYGVYKAFLEEFKEKTGIDINLCHHSADDDGDCYDEVDGAYFELDFGDVYQLTPEAKALQKTAGFEMKFFVKFC